MTRVDRMAAAEWYRQNRARTRALFDLIDPSAYYARPIALRNPIVFYEGHLPAFSVISFLKRCFGWDRCAWRSFRSFRAYTWGSVVAANLIVLARHALA